MKLTGSTPCRTFADCIPQLNKITTIGGKTYVQRDTSTNLYTPQDEFINVSVNESDSGDGYDLEFMVSMEKKSQYVVSKPDDNIKEYLCNYADYLVTQSDVYTAYTSISVNNANGYLSYGYGLLGLPVNLKEIRERINSSSSNGEHPINDMIRKNVLVTFNPNVVLPGNNIELIGDGMYCPYTLKVLPFTEENNGLEGNVYDRFYEVEEKVDAFPIDITPANGIWVDLATTSKSIRLVETNDTYKELIFNDKVEDNCIPIDTRKKVKDLVFNLLKVDNSYFNNVLTQLKQFLLNIDTELKYNLTDEDKNGIVNLCNFKYDIIVAYPTHEADNDKWDDKNDGLFGFKDTSSYENNLNSFNEHLYMEFLQDHAKPGNSVADLNKRDYHFILKNNYKTIDDINVKKQLILNEIYELLDKHGEEPTDIIDVIFDKESDNVRYINAIRTSITTPIKGMYVCDGFCHIFTEKTKGGNELQWNSMESGSEFIGKLLDSLMSSSGNDWTFKFS